MITRFDDIRLPAGALGLAAVTMLLALGACGEIASAEPAKQGSAPAVKLASAPPTVRREVIPAPLLPPFREGERPGDPVTPALLVGRWTDVGNCAQAIEFFANGRFVAPTGLGGRWAIKGDTLHLEGTRPVTARMHLMQRNAIMLSHPNGVVGFSERCVPAGEG